MKFYIEDIVKWVEYLTKSKIDERFLNHFNGREIAEWQEIANELTKYYTADTVLLLSSIIKSQLGK